jgi:predicted unusual protein kinase regulating ubiquinone biosynthesis (AarF/ABC1/UbiB family)
MAPDAERPRGWSGARPTEDGIPGGRLERTAPLVGLGARTVGEAAVSGLRSRLTGADSTEFHVRTAERYVELLGRSKGALMKAGQMLSFVSLGPAVPAEFQTIYQAALTRLRSAAPPMAPELARTVLERELGRRTESAFAEFDWEPLAAASIGQVHAARMHDGRAVAVKIQYPGVAAAIRADLKNTELIATFLGLIFGLSPTKANFDIRGTAREMSARISEELDYRLEAANQAWFAEIYRGHPFIHVPWVNGELCTDRVLTQELVEGRSWSEALACEQHLRNQWSEAIFRFLFGSYHRFYMFYADPHPGNYLFHDDGSVSFLDFGCVKRFSREQAELMNTIVRECLRGNVGGTWRACVEGGFYRSSGSLTPEEVFAYWREPYEMYWGEQPFTITSEYVAAWIERRYSPSGASGNAFRGLCAPGEYTIMGRIEVGSMSVLAGLRPSNHWGSIAAEHFEGALPLTAMGKLERAFFAERQGATEQPGS